MVAVFDQMNQQVEHLRLHRHGLAAAGQLAKPDVQHMVGKVKLHGFIPVRHHTSFRRTSSLSMIAAQTRPAFAGGKTGADFSGSCFQKGRANLPSRMCAKSHRKRNLTEK
jgi:hypothetical protein